MAAGRSDPHPGRARAAREEARVVSSANRAAGALAVGPLAAAAAGCDNRSVTLRALAVTVALALVCADGALAAPAIKIEVRSNARGDLVSAGDALIGIRLPAGADPARLRVRVGRRNVARAFAMRPSGRLEGLVSGLRVGRNVLRATLPDGRGAKLTITNHPNGGPVFSGPQIQPWECQETAVDAQCNEPATFELYYRSTDPTLPGLQPYDPQNPPSDIAVTTTQTGVRMPFIVRRETGYQDRDQYTVLTLYRPGDGWDRWSPPEYFNHKLLITHGGGCGTAHGTGTPPLDDYSGTLPPPPLRPHSYVAALGRGFAVMSTALDNSFHSCNAIVAAESLMMAKEHVIESYGDLRYTIGTGCSGGSLTQLQISNAFPRAVYDGHVISCSYPDTLTPGLQFAEYHLLRKYFEDPGKWDPGVTWTPAQWAPVEGHLLPLNAILADEGLFKGVISPTAECVGVSDQERYHPETNPGGARCDIMSYLINQLGPRPPDAWGPIERRIGRGFAGVPLGNVGVQYGLESLEEGLITPGQFADLNEKIGGLDIDGNPTPQRIVGDDGAIANAYRSGTIDTATNLNQVPIIAAAGPEPGAAHDFSHTMWTRWRIEREHGHAYNFVTWFGLTPAAGDLTWATDAMLAMDRWLSAIERDESDRPLTEKIVVDKPGSIHDRCTGIAGLEEFAVPGIGKVCELDLVRTNFGTPRQVAGGPRTNDAMKCQLRPLRREDYKVNFSNADWAKLERAFPTGVCDWSRPGVGQQQTIAWQHYGSTRTHVYGGRRMARAPRSRALRPCSRRRATCRTARRR